MLHIVMIIIIKIKSINSAFNHASVNNINMNCFCKTLLNIMNRSTRLYESAN